MQNSIWAEFRIDVITCQRENSVSMEFIVDGIHCRRNFVSTEFRVEPTESNLKKYFYYF
jgi:hypothetical protein